MRKPIALAVAAVAVVLGLGACGKQVDIEKADAKLVPGTAGLYWFCHATTLVYFENYGAEDSYEAFFAFGCNPDGTMADAFVDPTREAQGDGDK